MRRNDRVTAKAVLKTRSEKSALRYLRRLRAKGARANLVTIVGFYTRTGRRFREYEVWRMVAESVES